MSTRKRANSRGSPANVFSGDSRPQSSKRRSTNDAAGLASTSKPSEGDSATISYSMPMKHTASHFHDETGRLAHAPKDLSWVSVLNLDKQYVVHFDASESENLKSDDLQSGDGFAKGAAMALVVRLSDGQSVWKVRCEAEQLGPSPHFDAMCEVFDHVERALQGVGENYSVVINMGSLSLDISWSESEGRAKQTQKRVRLPLELDDRPGAVKEMMKLYIPQLLGILRKRMSCCMEVQSELKKQQEAAEKKAKKVQERAEESQKKRNKTLMKLLLLRGAKDDKARALGLLDPKPGHES